jgi:O-succinylbenzoate synthase
MLDSILNNLRVVSLSTRTDFRGINTREVALIEGSAGWGEFSPFIEYDENESIPWLISAIEGATQPRAKATRKYVDINATLPAVDSRAEVENILSWYPGATTVKIKVGSGAEKDLARIKFANEILPNAALRLDVNGAWGVEEALEFIYGFYDSFDEDLLQYIEQPCATLDELRELKAACMVPVKIAGDEVIRKAEDPFDLDLEDAVDILVLKVAPLGGIERSLALAAHHRLPVVVSSALESAVGIGHGIRLAGALPTLDFACGLATGQLLASDIANIPIEGGKMRVADVTPSEAAMIEFEASAERTQWWQDRVRKTWSAGADEIISEMGWHW